MGMVINNNSMAANAARNLNAHYASMSASTRRLSSGLRVNSSADDAAGLAIRELQRADIAALNQGARNANDAISLLQTADSALQIIDEKLIRMKELAEQASTGTYDSTQRLMIDSEFQAMASEIDRIAAATDFNGIHLLNGNLKGTHNGSGMTSTGALKVHFGSGNDSAEDYYYIDIDDCSVMSLFREDIVDWEGLTYEDGVYTLEISGKVAGNWAIGLDSYVIPSGLKNLRIESQNGVDSPAHKPHVNLFSSDGTQLTGYSPTTNSANWWNGMSGAQIVQGNGFASDAVFDDSKIINTAGQTVSHNGLTVNMVTSQNEAMDAWEVITIDKVTDNMVFLIGGHSTGLCNNYDLRISFEADRPSIATQGLAQGMLGRVDTAITRKDNTRAHIGSLQNRLENTVSNLTIQAENLQAAESRISDVDVSTEMTTFVRNQILTQAAVAMLSQANSMPRMAMQIIGG